VTNFDAIVVGSGISGGWVAKELCERGLKVLMLERGRETIPSEHYTDHLDPWEKKHFDTINPKQVERDFFIQGTNYAMKESTKHFWMKDSDQPYETNSGYRWRRGNQVGGRSLMWGRACYRLSAHDFEINKIDGEGVDWPVRYTDIAPWYDHVEKFAGISGNRDGMAQLPDGEHFLPAFDHTCVEEKLKTEMEGLYEDRRLIMGRVANLKRVTEDQIAVGRGQCQARNQCAHGCSYGAYFSSVSATLPAAKATGNLTLIADAIVTKVIYDEKTKRVTGVETLDANTRVGNTHTAKLVFLNASTIATSLLMLSSATETMPNGLANSSGQLGRNLMDHIGGTMVEARVDGFDDKYYYGRRPIGGYIPRYKNYPEQTESYKRGWGYQVYSSRGGAGGWKPGVGQAFKDANKTPGDWSIILHAFGECLPNPKNRITGHQTKTDKWGQPIAVIDLQLRQNEQALMRAAHGDAIDILSRAGFRDLKEIIKPDDSMDQFGGSIHEMGTARMGRDPKTSVLNGWNQTHDIDNLFITDGSFMTSSASQNPSLTYMAFSARAAHHAADLLEQGVL
jgi:choline dehydrogenase-like flavoprotein